MKKLIAALIVVNIGIISVYTYDKLTSPKTACVIIQDVFNSFELKKDYERKLTATKSARQRITDSLELDLKLLGKKIESESGKNKEDLSAFSLKREYYFQKKRLFDEDNELQTKKYDDEIIGQLNQYVKDYGKENGYTYIYGNSGSGSLMYADDMKNITTEVIAYINDRYKGVK
ncbi:MAG: OmpH family outer membrane protein [Bacteroidia bacterium]